MHLTDVRPAVAEKQNSLPCCALWLSYLICCQRGLSKMDFSSCTDVVFSCLCLWTIFLCFPPFLWGLVWFCLFPAMAVCSQTLQEKSGSFLSVKIDLSLTSGSWSLFSIAMLLGTFFAFVCGLLTTLIIKMFKNHQHLETKSQLPIFWWSNRGPTVFSFIC